MHILAGPVNITPSSAAPLGASLAARLRAARTQIAARWLERIAERVTVTPDRVFPSQTLLDHVPDLIDGLANFVEDPAQTIAADSAVVAKARELGALRHGQGFDAYEILKEYELFGSILFSFIKQTVDTIEGEFTHGELAACYQRVFQGISLIQQATAAQYLELTERRVAEREDRLRAFNRALTHEFRNRIGAVAGASELLDTLSVDEADRRRLAGIVMRNVGAMRVILDNLLEMTRFQADSREHRHVRLPRAAAEAARQLRDAAREAHVEVMIASDLPDVELSAAAVELCLTNFLSNAIKYSDPAVSRRRVEVAGRLATNERGEPAEVVIEVRDNGLGVAESDRPRLFERFFRAHTQRAPDVEGTGLGLNIVREAVHAVGGRVWAEFPNQEQQGAGGPVSVFAVALPCRRATDADAIHKDGADNEVT